uniref:Rap-GAP domain-containing protein n=1 Tax=Romanomermis culicivorax TaxID=13658 RepID=A0A915IG29_ROMCU
MDSSSSSSASHIEHKRVWELKNRTTVVMESDSPGQPRSRAFTMFSKLSDVKKTFISPYWTANGVAGGQSKNEETMDDMRPRTKSSPSSPNSRNVTNPTSASPWTSRAANSMQKRSIKKQQYYGCLEFPPPSSSSASVSEDEARTPIGATKSIIFFRLEPAAFEQTSTNDVYQGDEGCPPSPVILEDPENETRWYYRYFLGKEHQNYAGIDNNKSPYFLSVRVDDNPESHKYRAIMWQNMELLNLEEQEILINFKCGIIFSFCNQKSDDDMLSNEFGNADFDNFLHLLGDKISLENWPRFRGGLDARTNSTGTHSFYTNFQDYEIMFHVSTLLPYSKGNKQQLERKRHIGNDIVNIIFESGGDPKQQKFRPSFVKSKFTHIFAVVTFDFSVNCY